MNYKWWELRERYQGVVPPVVRSEQDFDAGAKFHVPANVPYIRYYVSHFLQFEFYRQLCLDSGQFDPNVKSSLLHKCDFSIGEKSKAAAQKLITLLKSGASEPWPVILERFTGKKTMDASAIVQYFSPLEKWLDEFIEQNNLKLGWKSTFKKYFNLQKGN